LARGRSVDPTSVAFPGRRPSDGQRRRPRGGAALAPLQKAQEDVIQETCTNRPRTGLFTPVEAFMNRRAISQITVDLVEQPMKRL